MAELDAMLRGIKLVLKGQAMVLHLNRLLLHQTLGDIILDGGRMGLIKDIIFVGDCLDPFI